MKIWYKWKRIVAMVMAILLLIGNFPMDVYAMPMSESEEGKETVISGDTKSIHTISVEDIVTYKDGGADISDKGTIGKIGQGRVLYFNLDLSDIEVEEGKSIREAVLYMTASGANECRELTKVTARDLTGQYVVSGSAVSPLIEDEDNMEELPASLTEWNRISEKDMPVVFEGVSVKRGERVEQDLTAYLSRAILNGEQELTLAVYGTEEADYSSNGKTLDLTEIGLSVEIVDSDVILNEITETDQEAEETDTIPINTIVSVNNKGQLQSPNTGAVGMIGRGRVMYFELDLSTVNLETGKFISDAKLNINSSGSTRTVTIRDLTECVRIDGTDKIPTITDTDTLGSLPLKLEAWGEVDKEKVSVIQEGIEIKTGTEEIDLTDYIASVISKGTKKLTIAIYGYGDDYGDGAGNPNKSSLDPKEISFSITIMDSSEMASNALNKLEEYLKDEKQYGDNLTTFLSKIELPTNINEILGIDEKITLDWKKESEGDGTIIYTATVTCEGKSTSKDFTFTLVESLKLTPSILRVHFYKDQKLEELLDKPAASDGASAWYLRSDYVTFLSFDLTDFLTIREEKYVKEALFEVVGGRSSGGAANTISVICLEDPIGKEVVVPEVSLWNGKDTLSVKNLDQIAGTTILQDQEISQLEKDTNQLVFSESIYKAIRDGKERITFLLISNEDQKGRAGCDLKPETAVLNLSLAEYTDEKWLEEASQVLQEKYENFYTAPSQKEELISTYGNGKVKIEWNSGDSSVISNQGVVADGFVGTKDVIMKATLTCGQEKKEISLNFHVCDNKYYKVYCALEKIKRQMDYLKNKPVLEDIALADLSETEVEVTWSSNKSEVINIDSGTGVVIRPDTYKPDEEVELTAHIALSEDSGIYADYTLKLTVAALTDEDNAAAFAKRYLNILKLTYDGSVVVEDYTLPAKMDETDRVKIQVEWSLAEENEYYKLGESTEAGYPVTVIHPKQPQKVTLHCKVSVTGKTNTKYTAEEEADFTVTVAAEQEDSPYGEASLRYMVAFGKKLYAEINGENETERILSVTKKEGEWNDIYDVQNMYQLQLGCDIDKLVEEEKFPFLYYPYEYNSDTILTYKRMQVIGVGGTTGSTPGALDRAKADAFKQALDEGEAALQSRSAQTEKYKEALNKIITTGTELLESAHIDNTAAVKRVSTGGDGKTARENLLVFSSARKNLLLKVWEAKTTLYQDSEMYLLSDKRALVEQIQNSENALSGTYQYPQNTYREFRERRDDEVLIFCLSHQVRFRNYDSTIYGLEPILSYYKKQAMISGSYYEMTIPVKEALAVNEGNKTSGAASELTVGEASGVRRFALLKFDLSTIQGEVQYASLKITSKKNDASPNQVFLEELDNWSGSKAYETLSNKYGADGNGRLNLDTDKPLVSFSPIGNGKSVLAAITDAVIAEQNKDKTISLRVQSAGETTYPNGYVGTENTEYGQEDWPMLKVTVGIINTSLLEENRETLMQSKRSFLSEISDSVADIGSYGSYHYENAEIGAYPLDLYDAAEKAYQEAEDAEGAYKKAEALVKLCDAVRILKDNQILATDLDSDTNLFFTSGEMEEVKNRIDENQELKAKYNEIKALSDQASLEELRTLKEAIFTSDMNTIDELGVLNFSGIGSGNNAKTIKTKEMKSTKGSASDIAYGELVVRLSSENYKGKGVDNGYFAYVDTFELKDSSGNVVKLTNSDFANNASGWHYVGIDTSYQSAEDRTLKGSSGKWDTTTSSRKETGCLYFENQTSDANGAWVSDQFAMKAGEEYSLTYQLKQHIVFSGEGVTVIVRYYNENGEYIGYSANYGSNFKSAASFGSWSSRFQADAVVYAISGDATYAEKCILDLILGANDFAQGSEHWMYNTSRPYGIDAYGAVQGGRFVNCLATAYSIVKNYSGWNEEDRQLLADLCLYITGDLNDIRDRSEMTPAEAAYNTTNWNMDMAIGSAMLGLAFNGMKGWEYGLQYYNNGYNTLFGQCTEMNIYGQDGSWNESVRYHNAAISKICVFAKTIRNMLGENWFAEDADVQLGKSLFYNVLLQTPGYAYSEEKRYIGTPVYGDHVLTNGSEFSYLGLYFDEVARVNPIQAYSMYKTWEKAGSPLPALSGDSNMMENFFAPLEFSSEWLMRYSREEAEEAYQSIGSTDTGSMGVDADLNGIVTEEENQNVMDYWEEQKKASSAASSNEYKSHGIMIFRNHFNEEDKESYLSMMANEQKVEHNHNDQLGIQLFANSTPLVIDVGIGGYWDLSKATYTLSSAHGLTQFINADGSEKATLNAAKDIPASAQLDFYASDQYDFMSAQTWNSTSHNDGTITRSIGYVKNGFEAYIIWDQVKGEAEEMRVQYNLPLYAQETPTLNYEDNRVTMKGFHNTNLDILFLEGNLTENTASIDTIMLPTSYIVEKRNPADSAATVDLLHVKSEKANQDFLTVLFPSDAGTEQKIEAEKLESSAEGVQIYQLTYTDEAEMHTDYIIINGTESAKVVSLPNVTTELVNLKEISAGAIDTTKITVAKNTMLVLGKAEEKIVDCSHTNTEVKNVKEATCEEDGYTGDTYCKDCGERVEKGIKIEVLGHDYSSEVTKEPTTKEEGIRTYTCSRCGDTYEESIEKLTEEDTSENPEEPSSPEKPEEPNNPEKPTEPNNPEKPTEPSNPEKPTEPNNPEKPTEPDSPEKPTVPGKPTVDRDDDDDSDSSSVIFQGIHTKGEGNFYIKADGTIAKNEWILYRNHWYYAGANGMLKTGWLQTVDQKWYYLLEDCAMATGWNWINEKWYYLEDKNGDMLEGWKYTGNKWYYLNPVSGDMATGWKLINDKWYCFEDKNGDMLEGWKFTGDKWYYLNPISGDMATGWKLVNGKWYYLNPENGDMAIGWKKINEKWYYLTSEGDCLLDTITPDGYTVNEKGEWVP